MKRMAILASAMLAGCTVTIPNPFPQQPQVVYQDRVVYRDTPAKPKPQASSPTFGDAVDLCRAVHDRSDIPMGCDVDFLDDEQEVPALTIAIPSLGYWEQKKEHFAANIGAPFCVGAARHWPKSVVIMAVHDVRMMRYYSCTLNEWSEWMDMDDEDPEYM